LAQFPLERQFDEKDGGPACLSMISRYYGKTFGLEMLRRLEETNREGAPLSIVILTDFIIKLMKLPASFFETRMTGDILQRMNDQRRIQSFFTGPALNVSFSTFTLLIFSVVLIYYSFNIILVFWKSQYFIFYG